MKIRYLIIVFILMMASSCRRPLPTQSFAWSEVVNCPGVSKEQLYHRAVEWYNATFNSMKAAIENADKESGTFYAHGIIPLHYGRKGEHNISFSVNISVKDGKYKYTLSNFVDNAELHKYKSRIVDVQLGDLQNGVPNGGYRQLSKGWWIRIRNDAHSRVPELITKLKSTMASKALPETF